MQLSQEADRLLRKVGYDIFGRVKEEVDHGQVIFESRMQTGAYSRNSESGKRK